MLLGYLYFQLYLLVSAVAYEIMFCDLKQVLLFDTISCSNFSLLRECLSQNIFINNKGLY